MQSPGAGGSQRSLRILSSLLVCEKQKLRLPASLHSLPGAGVPRRQGMVLGSPSLTNLCLGFEHHTAPVLAQGHLGLWEDTGASLEFRKSLGTQRRQPQNCKSLREFKPAPRKCLECPLGTCRHAGMKSTKS